MKTVTAVRFTLETVMFEVLFQSVGPIWTGMMLLAVVGVVTVAPLAHLLRLMPRRGVRR